MMVTNQSSNEHDRSKTRWGPRRMVHIQRESGCNYGFSIVSGAVDGNGSLRRGIFVKSVEETSPAAKAGNLHIGDRIVEIEGTSLHNETYDDVVDTLKKNSDSLQLVVQSLSFSTPEPMAEEGNKNEEKNNIKNSKIGSIVKQFSSDLESVVADKNTSNMMKDGSTDQVSNQKLKEKPMSQSSVMQKAQSSSLKNVDNNEDEAHSNNEGDKSKKNYSSEESSEDEDARFLEGNVYTKGGVEISRKSAGNVRRSAAEISADPEQEDEFGYTLQKIRKKYKSLKNNVMLVKVDKNTKNVGISLAGHQDRQKMAVFICGLHPKGAGSECGQLQVGDELLEANGHVLQNRSHLNVSVVMKGLAGTYFKLVIYRRPSDNNDVAIPPITQFPRSLDDLEQYSNFEGVRTAMMKKGQYGLGIMIVEGKHADVGQGIFISDVQEGSVAEQGGLQVGDLILGLNSDTLLGCSYDEATQILKRAEGMITIIVCNPNKNKQESSQPGPDVKASPSADVAGPNTDQKKTETPGEQKKPEVVPKPASGKPITIELTRPKDSAMGLIVCGGTDTPSKGVFVLDVYGGGVVEKDGRIKPGDQILEYGGENFKTIEQARAQSAVLTMSGVIKINVLQDEPLTEKVEVEIQRKIGKGVGLSLVGFKKGQGAYIAELIPGGSALESGKLAIGDQIVTVCKDDVRNSSTEDVATHIKISDPLKFEVLRYKVR